MNASEKDIIQKIKQLPIAKRFYVIEEALKSIKKDEAMDNLDLAADVLYEDYVSDKDLTAFTALDFEHFYEAK